MDVSNATVAWWDTMAKLVDTSGIISTTSPIPKPFRTTVAMDDGTLLVTYGIIPRPTEKRPAVVCRSPYGPFTNSLASLFTALGYVAVMQNMRGTFDSQGTFDMYRSAASDGRQTLDWIVKQPWSNGQVYSVGISADGMGEIAMILEKPPMLKGQWWAWTTGNGHGFVFPHGAYRQDLLEGYMHAMSISTRGASQNRVIPELRNHEAWSTWWQNITDCRNPSPCHYANVDFPVVATAGWWDIFSQPLLDDWHGIVAGGDPSVREKHVLVVDPLGHCAMQFIDDVVRHSGLAFETASALIVSARLAGEYFVGNFNGSVRSRLGRINFFVMGAFGEPLAPSWWTSLDIWPKYNTSTFFFQSGRSLGADVASEDGRVSFLYDPLHPAPMLGGANIPFVSSTPGHCGSSDQLSRESRADVVVFDSVTLVEDMPVVGRIRVKLFVSSNASDTDFIVTLSDLTPGLFGPSLGKKSMLVRYGALRMRWRDSDADVAAPLSAGQVYPVVLDLMSIAYVFPKGHKIRIAVSSSAAPHYNPNDNTGKFAPAHKSSMAVVARNTIHFGPRYPSSIALPVVHKSDIPPNHHFHDIKAELQSQPHEQFV
jgi:putative CocE/NonD family hydrolase